MLRFVGALRDSVLQGEVIVAEPQLHAGCFPRSRATSSSWSRTPSVRTSAQATALAGVFERELGDLGADAVATTERLAAFHRVENTYLSTFQALGRAGTAARHARACGGDVPQRARSGGASWRSSARSATTATRLSTMVLAEAALLLGAGLGAGADLRRPRRCPGVAQSRRHPAWVRPRVTPPDRRRDRARLGIPCDPCRDERPAPGRAQERLARGGTPPAGQRAAENVRLKM